jgi:hypothetical protein
LLPLPIAAEIDRARKIFTCVTFDLPTCTSRVLTYVLFPSVPPVFLLAKRRLAFYKRAQDHDLDCVKECFLFDMTFLYPHDSSWVAQTRVILEELDVTFDDRRMNFVECLEKVTSATRDVEGLCFRHVRESEDKTLSFFRIFPNPATARDFRSFLSTLPFPAQDLLILFLSSGLRWRYFQDSSRGTACPLCSCHFWSWEHFLQCRLTQLRSTLYLETQNAAFHGDWSGLVCIVRFVLGSWLTLAPSDRVGFSAASVHQTLSVM